MGPLSNIMSLEPRPASLPSGIFVARDEAYLRAKFHLDQSNRLATVHQRHRQDRQADSQTDRQRDRQTDIGIAYDSIGRTVLQTVVQKACSIEVKTHNFGFPVSPSSAGVLVK